MKHQVSITVLGGDARQSAAADHLAQNGCAVRTWGLAQRPCRAAVCDDAAEAVQGAEALLLPLPVSRDRLQLNGTDLSLGALYEVLRRDMTVYCGRPDERFVREVRARGAIPVDYSADEVFMIRNALPTAEGALAIAMNALDRTLFASDALVIGYGRIGKLLADLLIRMGAHVTVAARKQTDLALAALHGAQTLLIPTQGGESVFPATERDFHVLFNTVPVPLIGEQTLRTLSPETVLIDLASAPGGIDYDAAGRLGRKTVIALALPGKVAPVTAGEIIGDCVLSHMEGGITSP